MVPLAIKDRYSHVVQPLHAIFLAGMLPLFLGATLSDAAYVSSYEIQWNNFASWLITGGMIFASIALVFALVDACRPRQRVSGILAYTLILLAIWIVGFLNALMHARDAWASMPLGLILSVIVFLLAAVATWFGFSTPRFAGGKK